MRFPERSISLLVPVLIVGVLGVVPAAAQSEGAPPVGYRLQEGSTYQEGCFPPCMCPLLEPVPMEGTFDLVHLPFFSPLERLGVANVSWTVPLLGRQLTGSGTYTLAGDLQQLTLDLRTDDGPAEPFDSGGLVPGGDKFPTIDITISRNQMYCYDVVLHVRAEPVDPASLVLAVGADLLGWTDAADAGGYDVVCGDLGTLGAAGFTAATDLCLADDHPDASLGYSLTPAPGEGVWFLVRAATGAFTSYDSNEPSQSGSRDGAIEASALACP